MKKSPTLGPAKTMTMTRQGESTLLECSHCFHLLGADEIDLEHSKATCNNCQATIDLDDILRSDPYRRPEVVMPDGVELLKLSNMLDIVVDWYRSSPKRMVGSLVFGSFFWNIVLLPLVFFFLFAGDFLLVLFFIGHITTGIALVAYLLSIFVNKSHIEVTTEGIRIRHEPLPSPLNKKLFLPKAQIDQLFVAKHHQRFGKKKSKVPSYTLHALSKQGKVIDLVTGMDLETQLYLEQEIETYLEIQDRPISKEVKRK
ncbi:MAG: hypothetical protein KTR24_00730 [Saprospiraceae bacterium]|nr:hypothetical protein [Saprospiraceae bacterium]